MGKAGAPGEPQRIIARHSTVWYAYRRSSTWVNETFIHVDA